MSKSKNPPFFKDTTILDLRECYLNALTYYDRLVVAGNFEKITECEAGVSNDTFYFVNTCALACEISMKQLVKDQNYTKIHQLDELYEGCSGKNQHRLECQYEKSTKEAAGVYSTKEIPNHPLTLKPTATLFKDAFLNSRYHTEDNEFFKGLIEGDVNLLSLMVLTHACVAVAITEWLHSIKVKVHHRKFPHLPSPSETLPHVEELHDHRLDIVNSRRVRWVSLLDIYRNSLCSDTTMYFKREE